jgi:2-dehydro-3-deoxyphosphogluconate aldolase/(4S)-4-hydroxy-2-oxoglutarate aldolase
MYPGVVTGAGTVLSVGQAERAMGAGARFIVSPGFDPAVADWCLERNIPALPGVATPTEILMALGRGIDLVKFFPAEALGGVTMLEAVAAPFGNVRFVPTGGINAHNFPAYLRLKAVVACGGSWLASGAMLRSGNYAEITRLTREAVAIIGEAGAKGGHPRQEETAS